jgi:hypothetical protein
MDKKEIRLPYSEYKEMIDTIEKQNEALDKIKSVDGTIVIDNRYNYCRSRIDEVLYSIPKIMGGDEAKAFLKDEFENLYKEVWELRQYVESLNFHREKGAKKLWQ